MRNTLAAVIDDDQTKMTFNAGVLFSPNPTLSLGAVYKRGADFGFWRTSLLLHARPLRPGAPGGQVPVTLPVPHSFGAGARSGPATASRRRGRHARHLFRPLGRGQPGRGVRRGRRGDDRGRDRVPPGRGVRVPARKRTCWPRARASTPTRTTTAWRASTPTRSTSRSAVASCSDNRVQIDAAANLADTVREGLLSFVVRF